MKLDEQKRRYRALNEWGMTPQGSTFLNALKRQLRSVEPYIDATVQRPRLLQLGLKHRILSVEANPYLRLSPCLEDIMTSDVVASPLQLPFKQNTFDVVVAPFVFEMIPKSNMHLNLMCDAIDGVLNPMGCVVMVGVNPLSFWGLAFRRPQHLLGQSGIALCASYRVKRAWAQRGYRLCWFDAFYYVPPFESATWIHRSAFLNEMAKMIAPCPAGFYILVMQKYEHSMLGLQQVQHPYGWATQI